MQPLTRRSFLTQSSLVTLGALPGLVHRGAVAAETTDAADGRILVVIQMTGGNDGINTVVPYADEGYARHRKELRIPSDGLLKISDSSGLHPSMRAAADLLQDGRLCIVQGVGYPNPNRSHELSMAIWHSAQLDEKLPRSHGWLGRAMDQRKMSIGVASSNPEMILIGDEAPPLAIQSRKSTAIAMDNLKDLQLDNSMATLHQDALDSSNDLVSFARQTTINAVATARALATRSNSESSQAAYPSTRLAQRLQSVAQLIKCGFSTPVYYTIQAGYDTHAAQLPSHSRLLREFSDAIKAFLNDLNTAGLSDRVAVMGFSEFGRRVAENTSGGTDHGTAGPVFIAGDHVNAGIMGLSPNLNDLLNGDLQMTTDFRSVYSSLLSDWLRVEQQEYPGLDPIPGIFSCAT